MPRGEVPVDDLNCQPVGRRFPTFPAHLLCIEIVEIDQDNGNEQPVSYVNR